MNNPLGTETENSQELYENLEGKLVRVDGENNHRCYGRVDEIDFVNKSFVLTDYPMVDYAEKELKFKDNVILPYRNKRITPLTEENFESICDGLAQQFEYIGDWVRIETQSKANIGKLKDITPHSYLQKPFLLPSKQDDYEIDHTPRQIPKTNQEIITPVREDYLDDIISRKEQ